MVPVHGVAGCPVHSFGDPAKRGETDDGLRADGRPPLGACTVWNGPRATFRALAMHNEAAAVLDGAGCGE